MRELLADEALAQRIGAAGRQAALARFSYERFAAQWEQLLLALDPQERFAA